MALLRAEPISLTPKERQQLQTLARKATAPQRLVVRAQIILLADEGVGVRETAARLGIGRQMVQDWRRRWRTTAGAVAARLSDLPRPGTPPTFSPEQICAILALACEEPQASGCPMKSMGSDSIDLH